MTIKTDRQPNDLLVRRETMHRVDTLICGCDVFRLYDMQAKQYNYRIEYCVHHADRDGKLKRLLEAVDVVLREPGTDGFNGWGFYTPQVIIYKLREARAAFGKEEDNG